MKMFRLALAGALSAFVLFVCIQLNARAASTPRPPEMPCWFTGDNTVNDHIWQSVVTLYNNGATYARVKVAAPSQSRQLFFEDRVAYQRAIEEVYWRHRIWPKQRPDPKPSLDAVMSQATIEQKVQDYLRHSELLEQEWQKPITLEQLQAEMDRIAQHTKQPEVLRELFAALGNDLFVIAECLARPVLTERLIADLSAQHQAERPESLRTAGLQMPKKVAAIDSIAKAVQVNRPYQLPVIAGPSGGCIDDSWTATSTTNAPTARELHTAVWTGSEMIVWGGNRSSGVFNTGGRYDPSTDSWTATSTTNAPTARENHTAVWTGSEMIIWGGDALPGFLNTGGRYNPGTNSWTATTTTNAPTARNFHTAVWTGSEMIVWGGNNSGTSLNTGGRYNPITDSWAATSTTNAPDPRSEHTAVWTGSEMIVWGGWPGFGSFFNTGGRYNPSTNSWTATATINAPTGRFSHTAVWTDSEMIVWGGFVLGGDTSNTGGRYNPSTDSWTATSTTNAPTERQRHTAVWTDTEMIVWGGFDLFQGLNTGGRYNPGTDSWTATSRTNAPTGRSSHTAVWTNSEMIVWGGLHGLNDVNTGGRYCAQAGSPTPTPTPPPQIRLSAEGRKVNE
jgi:N-acetylneuraminic acid mutarotase